MALPRLRPPPWFAPVRPPQRAVLASGRSGAEWRRTTLADKLRELRPKDEAQRWLQSRALQVSGDLAQARWLLVSQVGSVIPRPFLVVLVFWLTVLFVSFGLFAPCNATVALITPEVDADAATTAGKLRVRFDPSDGFRRFVATLS